MVKTLWMPVFRSAYGTSTLSEASGLGTRRSRHFVMTASVPSEPMRRCLSESPLASLTCLPPTCITVVEQPARFDIGLQVLQEHTGLDRDGHRVLVELEHAVHAGKVEDDAALERHGRADKIRPRAARRDGNAVLVRAAQERAHLLGG